MVDFCVTLWFIIYIYLIIFRFPTLLVKSQQALRDYLSHAPDNMNGLVDLHLIKNTPGWTPQFLLSIG